MMTLGQQAIRWIMSAPVGEKRSQSAAAEKFGITQGVVSLTLKRYVTADLRPDARRKLKEKSK